MISRPPMLTLPSWSSNASHMILSRKMLKRVGVSRHPYLCSSELVSCAAIEQDCTLGLAIRTFNDSYGVTIAVVVPHNCRGARWLSGRVSDSGARGPGFETYRRRVVSLSKTLYSPKVLVNYPGSDGSVPI